MIIHEIHVEGMVLSESFQVAIVIGKLPPAWKDFKNYLMHKRKEMSMEDLVVRLRIEEDNRRSDKQGAHDECKTHLCFELISHAILCILYPYSCKTHKISSKLGFVGLLLKSK